MRLIIEGRNYFLGNEDDDFDVKLDLVRTLPGVKFLVSRRAWRIPMSVEAIATLVSAYELKLDE